MRSEQYVAIALERTKGRVKTNDTVTGLYWLLAGVILYLLVVIIVDQASPLERSVRLNLLLVLAGLAVAGLAVTLLWPTLRRVNDLYAARLIERQAEDQFRNSVTSLVQLAADAAVPQAIKAAVAAKAAADLETVDLDAVVDRRPLRWATITLLVTLALLVVFAVTTPKSFGTSLGRAVGFEFAAPTATRILNVRPPNPTTIMAGDDVKITVDVGGKIPDAVSVTMTHDGSYWDTAAMEPEADGRWTFVLSNLLQDIRFRVRAGDARSDEHVVEVRPLPAITAVATRVVHPDYTLLGTTTHDTGNVEALAGSRVEVIVQTNQPPKRPLQLVWSRGTERTPLGLVSGTTQARGTFTVHDEDSYYIYFYDQETQRANSSPVTYHVRALADAPPTVEIAGAGPSVSVPEGGQVTLAARARDDYGLDRLTLGWRRESPAADRGKEHVLPPLRTAPGDRAVLRMDESVALSVADLGLKAGDEASVWFTATDRLPSGAQQGRSEEIRIVVTPPESGTGAGDGDQTADASGKQPREGDDRGEGTSGADGSKKPLTDREREQLEKLASAVESRPNGDSGDGGNQGDRETQGDGGGKPKPDGQQPDPRQGDSSGGGDSSTGGDSGQATGGPAADADDRADRRSPDAEVGERPTTFDESGRSTGASPADARLLRTVGPVLRRLEDQLRTGSIDPELLKDLGWSEAELRRFVIEYKARFDRMADSGDDARSASDTATVPAGDVTASRGDGGHVGGGTVEAGSDGPGDEGEAVEVRKRRPLPRFERLIKEYTKAVSEAETQRD